MGNGPQVLAVAEQVEVFFGQVTPSEARVYLRLPRALAERNVAEAVLHGPGCRLAHTLPARIPFRRLSGEPWLAEAIVPDPCCWTPQQPYRYDVSVSFADEAAPLVIESWGIRPLARRGRDLLLAGRRWVLRAAAMPGSLGMPDWPAWREAELAMMVPAKRLTEEALRAAGEWGVLIVADLADLADTPSDALAEVRRLARWPAVGIAILPGEGLPDGCQKPRNILLGQRISQAESDAAAATWTDMLFVDAEMRVLPGSRKLPERPTAAIREERTITSPAQGRRACERLQHDLAPHTDLAGYVVVAPAGGGR